MDTTNVEVALIGRNSTCKSSFLKAACSADTPPAKTTPPEAQVWWTPTFAPRQTELVQAPVHGFSSSGERLLPARLRQVSAAEVSGGEEGERGIAILLVLAADVVFHKGQPRPSRGGSNPVKAAVSRTRDRLGGGQVPFAVAVSVDVEDGAELVPSTVKVFLASVRDDLAAEGVPFLPVSPRTELWLREQESEGGRVAYRRGDSQFRIPSAFEQLMDMTAIARARAAFDLCGGTGIMAAVSAAVALRPPTLVFPVGDFVTLQSWGWGGDGAPTAPLRTFRLLRALSTARDVYSAEKSEGIASGDLVSAEIVPASADLAARESPLPLELDKAIGGGAWVVRLVTTRKAAQVWKVGAAAASGGRGGKPLAGVQFGDLRSKERRRGRS